MSKKTILIFLTILLLLGLTVSASHTQTKETTKPKGPCNWVAAYGLGLTITRIEREKDYTSVWLAFRRISNEAYPKQWDLTITDDRGNKYMCPFHLPFALDLPPRAGDLLKDSPPDYWSDLPIGFTWIPSSPVVVKIPQIAPIAKITLFNHGMFNEWNFQQKNINLSFKASCFPNLNFQIQRSNLIVQGQELIRTKNFLLSLDSAKTYKKIEKDGTYISCIIRIKGQNFDYNPQYPPSFTFFLQLSSGRVIHLIDFSQGLEPASERILERLHRTKIEQGEEAKVILVYSSEMRFKGFISDIPPESSQPKTGKYVINLQFDGARGFGEGLANVKAGDKWGYIDKSGKYIIDPQFDFASSFSENLAAVFIRGKGVYGYIDKTWR
jgi:hypothetical protein